MIDITLALHIFDKLLFCLNGTLILLLLNQKSNILINYVGIPCVIVIFKNFIKERLVNVQCKTLRFLIVLLFQELVGVLLECLLSLVRVSVDFIEILCFMQVLNGFLFIFLHGCGLNQSLCGSIHLIKSFRARRIPEVSFYSTRLISCLLEPLSCLLKVHLTLIELRGPLKQPSFQSSLSLFERLFGLLDCGPLILSPLHY